MGIRDLFHKKRKLKNPEVIEHIRSRAIKYVSTRDENGVEYVLGHSGSISVKDDELIVYSEGRDVFRCNVYDAEVGELMSKDGVRLSYVGENGVKHAVTAYYVYRR